MAASADDLKVLYEATAVKLANIEQEMATQSDTLQNFLSAHGLDLETRLQNSALEMQQVKDVATGIQKNQADLETRFTNVDPSLQQWVTAAVQTAVGNLGPPGISTNKPGQIMPAKNMMPDKYNGEVGGWRRFKAQVENYLKAIDLGAYDSMTRSSLAEQEVNLMHFGTIGGQDFHKTQEIFMLLEKHATGDALGVIEGGEHGNGFEAWRRLHRHYEPTLDVQKGQVAAAFSALSQHPAKNAAELRKILIDRPEEQLHGSVDGQVDAGHDPRSRDEEAHGRCPGEELPRVPPRSPGVPEDYECGCWNEGLEDAARRLQRADPVACRSWTRRSMARLPS